MSTPVLKNGGRPLARVGWATVLALAAFLAAPGGAAALDFVTPPGQNVERQEALLKEQMTRLATTMIGNNLIDVVANVAYARTGAQPQGKLKLPGFNQYIDAGGKAGATIVPEFLRIRQVFVLVSKSVGSEAKSLERDLITQGELNPRRGDFLQVVVVDAAAGSGKTTGEGAAKRPRRPHEAPQLPTNEPESTVHLLRARTAYFKGNYDRALSQILKAVEVEPNSPQAYAMLGSLYYTINWKTLALKYWEKSLSLDPENQEIETLVAQLRDEQVK